MMKSLLLLATLVSSSLCFGASLNSDPEPQLFYLVEADAAVSKVMDVNGKSYNRAPVLLLKHFQKYSSFLNPDGTYGIILYINPQYQSLLYSLTEASKGKHILPVVNGSTHKALFVDKTVRDGKMVIWENLKLDDLRLLAKRLEPFDPKQEAKRFADEAPGDKVPPRVIQAR